MAGVGRVLAGLAAGLVLVVGLVLVAFDRTDELPSVSQPSALPDEVRAWAVPAPEGTLRVLVLGASLTAGYPYQPIGRGSYPELCGRGLAAVLPERRIEVAAWAKPALDSARLAAMAGRALDLEPDLLVVTLGSNEFANRVFWGQELVPTDPLARAAELVSRSRLLLQGLEGATGDAASKEEDLQRQVQGLIDRSAPGRPGLTGLPVSPADQALLVARLRRSMHEISAACAARNTPLLFCIAPYALGGYWPWGLSEGGPEAEVDALVRRFRRGQREGLLPEVAAACAARPGRADLRFLHGCLLRAGGRLDEARAEFVLARDLDRVPMHLTGSIQAAIREEAQALGRPLLELEQALVADGTPGLADTRWYLDYGHLRDRGHVRLAAWLAGQLVERRLLPGVEALPEGWQGPFVEAADRHLEERLSPLYRSFAQANIDMGNGNFLMLFGNYREALPSFVDAAEGYPTISDDLSIRLSTCVNWLGGRSAELLALGSEQAQARYRRLHALWLEAKAKGRIGEVVDALLDGRALEDCEAMLR